MRDLLPRGGGRTDLPEPKQILDAFIGLWIRDPEISGFTHARAEFEVNDFGVRAVQWKLIDADDSTIYRQHLIDLGVHAAFAVETCVRPYFRGGAERGQLTFRFNPPAVTLDLFDHENTTLVARHLIDEGRLS